MLVHVRLQEPYSTMLEVIDQLQYASLDSLLHLGVWSVDVQTRVASHLTRSSVSREESSGLMCTLWLRPRLSHKEQAYDAVVSLPLNTLTVSYLLL